MKVTNWGRFPVVHADVVSPLSREDAVAAIGSAGQIARGLGRSYGDASLAPRIVSSLRLDHFLDFDREKGTIRCEAGVSFDSLLKLILPEGWFLPVTPGTKYITVGGAIAADVHGKNHHKEGSFGRFVHELKLLDAQGKLLTCSLTENPELFAATLGGMGLTGIITEATFRLKKVETAWISQHTYKAHNLDQIFRLFEEHRQDTYTMAWIDCLATGSDVGKSVLFTGKHSTMDELSPSARQQPMQIKEKFKLNIPFPLPHFVLNNYAVKAFNALYFARHRHGHKQVVPYEPFFYPLDGILNWNRMYGSRGFIQYQCVLPLEKSYDGLSEILQMVAGRGGGSFLAVLKLFGPQDGLMSFPMSGYTLALDFPLEDSLLPFLDKLDEKVAAFGGRIYLAKDARMSREIFEATYPNLPQFRELLSKFDPEKKFRSRQSARLGI